MIRLCVREMAQDRGLRQIDLIKKSGLGPTAVSNCWHNRIQRVSFEVLEALGAALGVSGTNLLTDSPVAAPSRSMEQPPQTSERTTDA